MWKKPSSCATMPKEKEAGAKKMKPKNTENPKFVEKRRIKWNENAGKKW